MAKLLITTIATGGVLIYNNYTEPGQKDSFGLSVIITIIGTFSLASVFFRVQTIAVKTIFLCFVEDIERNDGSEERPYYMNNKLKQILQK